MSIKNLSKFCQSAVLAGGAVMALSLSACAEGPESLEIKASATTSSAFNWMANGNSVSQREARARQNALRASMISSRDGATWICSPAGFGRKSRCYRG